MKKLLTFLTLSFITFAFTLQTAEAKRFGMGGSYGYSKKIPPKQFGQASKPKADPQATKPVAAQGGKAAGQPSGASRWLGPLAGLAAGGLLAAMLFGDGFENIQIMDMLIFGLIAFLLFKLFASRRRQAAEATADHADAAGAMHRTSQSEASVQHFQAQAPTQSSFTPGNEGGSIIGSALSEQAEHVSAAPSWFDEQSFLEAAKHNFVEVQKAWDKGDLAEIQSYCSPELFEQLRTHVQPNVNHTEVDTLYAEIADMAVEGDDFIISIRFSGFIKEEGNLHAFNEIWHLRRPADGSGNWEIMGIQPGH